METILASVFPLFASIARADLTCCCHCKSSVDTVSLPAFIEIRNGKLIKNIFFGLIRAHSKFKILASSSIQFTLFSLLTL